MHLGRPEIGDKMFDCAADLGPSMSISESPLNNGHEASDNGYNYRVLYDSILDDDEQRSSVEDLLFEKTGQHSSSVSSDSAFGDDLSHSYAFGVLPQLEQQSWTCA